MKLLTTGGNTPENVLQANTENPNQCIFLVSYKYPGSAVTPSQTILALLGQLVPFQSIQLED